MDVVTYKAENIGNEQRDSIIPIGRLDSRLAAAILGFKEHDIPTLVASELLEPLGNPDASCTKYFAWEDIKEKARDRKWLDKATDAVYAKWSAKNASRKGGLPKA